MNLQLRLWGSRSILPTTQPNPQAPQNLNKIWPLQSVLGSRLNPLRNPHPSSQSSPANLLRNPTNPQLGQKCSLQALQLPNRLQEVWKFKGPAAEEVLRKFNAWPHNPESWIPRMTPIPLTTPRRPILLTPIRTGRPPSLLHQPPNYQTNHQTNQTNHQNHQINHHTNYQNNRPTNYQTNRRTKHQANHLTI